MILLFLIFAYTPFKADRVTITNDNGERIIHLLGNVIIEQDETKISCLEAHLNETMGFVLLKDSVLIKDKDGEIRADNAIYFLNQKFSVLKGNVRFVSENRTISADSIEYDSEKKYVKMLRNVRLEEKENSIVAWSNEGWYDLGGEVGGLVKGPRLEIKRNEKPPIEINAREFLLKNQENLCFGYDSVIVVIDSITLFCDTLSYNLRKEKGYMKMPVAVEKNNELKGSSGEFGLKDKTIDYFKVYSGIASYWTADSAHNVIEGECINIIFQDGRAIKIRVEGNPKGRLYLNREKKNAGD